MKLIALLVSLSIGSLAIAQLPEWEEQIVDNSEVIETTEKKSNSSVQWNTSLEVAKELAAKNNKSILVFFTGSDWCAPCIALKEDFLETEDFTKHADDFVLLLIDYPRRKDILSAEQMKINRKVIDQYNSSKTFPKLVMLNKNGNEIGKLSGYSSYSSYKDTSHHIAFIDKYISK